MNNHIWRTKFIIWLSLFIALVLQTVPWPGPLEMMRPSWVLLVMFYWALALPHRANVGSALIVGLLWDLTIGSTLGIRGMMMSILVYIVALNFQVLRNMALWQQAILLAFLTMVGQLIEFFGESLIKSVEFNSHILWAGVVNCILWPWMFLLLRRVRRHWGMR